MNRVNRYLFSSFINTFISLFSTLYLIMSIVFFIQIARITSYIEITFGELLKLYLFMLPQILLFTVPIAFFVSVSMSFFRLSKENESTVLFTLGQDPFDITKFFMLISFILSIILLIDAIVIMPIAENLNSNFIDYKKTRLSLNIKPSEFGQRFGDWMVFIDGQKEENGTLQYKNIVLYNPEVDIQRFIISSSGSNNKNKNSNFELLLGNGKIYDINDKRWHISDYKNMIIRTSIKSTQNRDYSLSAYWLEAMTNDKRAKDLSIYTLVAIFPFTSILFALSFGIVTYRYEKGIIYFGIFGVLFVYFFLIMLVASHPIYAIPMIFFATFILSALFYNQKILKKY